MSVENMCALLTAVALSLLMLLLRNWLWPRATHSCYVTRDELDHLRTTLRTSEARNTELTATVQCLKARIEQLETTRPTVVQVLHMIRESMNTMRIYASAGWPAPGMQAPGNYHLAEQCAKILRCVPGIDPDSTAVRQPVTDATALTHKVYGCQGAQPAYGDTGAQGYQPAALQQ